MYLGKDIVKQILSNSSYEMDEIYVSCDYDKTKGSGELFELVLEKEKTGRDDMLHFGDNYISDYSEAIGKGIEAYQTPKLVDHILNEKENSYLLSFMKDDDSIASSVYLSQISEYLYGNKDCGFFEKLSYLLGGPLALSYLTFVCDKAKEENLDKLLFASRDGYLLKELYEKYFYDQTGIKAEYVYLSRACIYAGNEINHLCTDLNRFLKIMKLYLPELDLYNDPFDEYEKHKEEIEKTSISQSKNLERHLLEITKDSKKAATVDKIGRAHV